MEIKILGTGCPNCFKLENNTKLALQKLSMEAKIIKVTDIVDIMSYNIMSTPWLVIDWRVVSSGKVLNTDEIIELINLWNNDIQKPKSWWCCCGGNC